MAIALFQRRAISEVAYLYFQEEDRVYSREWGWGIIVKKERLNNSPRFWLLVDDAIALVEPCTVQL